MCAIAELDRPGGQLGELMQSHPPPQLPLLLHDGRPYS